MGRCVGITVWKGWSRVGARTGTLKNPTKCLWRWEPDRRSNFFFNPPAHLCAVTYMTEIFLIVTLNNQFTLPYLEFRSAVPEEKSKMPQPIRGQGGHLDFPIGPKNTNLVEDVEVLLPVMFRWILFSGFKGEVENVSANQKPGRQSCFSDRPEKHKLGRGNWDLASCQVSLNSVQRFQRRSRKCLSQSEARAAILFFRSVLKTQTW